MRDGLTFFAAKSLFRYAIWKLDLSEERNAKEERINKGRQVKVLKILQRRSSLAIVAALYSTSILGFGTPAPPGLAAKIALAFTQLWNRGTLSQYSLSVNRSCSLARGVALGEFIYSQVSGKRQLC